MCPEVDMQLDNYTTKLSKCLVLPEIQEIQISVYSTLGEVLFINFYLSY